MVYPFKFYSLAKGNNGYQEQTGKFVRLGNENKIAKVEFEYRPPAGVSGAEGGQFPGNDWTIDKSTFNWFPADGAHDPLPPFTVSLCCAMVVVVVVMGRHVLRHVRVCAVAECLHMWDFSGDSFGTNFGLPAPHGPLKGKLPFTLTATNSKGTKLEFYTHKGSYRDGVPELRPKNFFSAPPWTYDWVDPRTSQRAGSCYPSPDRGRTITNCGVIVKKSKTRWGHRKIPGYTFPASLWVVGAKLVLCTCAAPL